MTRIKISPKPAVSAILNLHKNTASSIKELQAYYPIKAHSSIQTVLSNFDKLPSSGFVRISVVMVLLGVSASTIWRLVTAGTLKTYKLTPRTTAFNVGELRELMTINAKQKCS